MTISLIASGSDNTGVDVPYYDFVIPGTVQKNDLLIAVFDVGYPHTINTLFCNEVGLSSGPLAADQAGLLTYSFGDTIPTSWHFYWSLFSGPVLVSWAIYRSSINGFVIHPNLISDTSGQNDIPPFGPDDAVSYPVHGRDYVYALGYTEPNGTVSSPYAPTEMHPPNGSEYPLVASSVISYTEAITNYIYTYGALLTHEKYEGAENVTLPRKWSNTPFAKGWHAWIVELIESPSPSAGNVNGIRVASNMINVYTVTDWKSNHNSMLFKYQWGTGVGKLMAGVDVGTDIFERAVDLTTDSYNDDVFVLSNDMSQMGVTVRKVADSSYAVSEISVFPGTSSGSTEAGEFVVSSAIDARSYSDKNCELFILLRRITYSAPSTISADAFEVWKVSTVNNWISSTQEKLVNITSVQFKDLAVSSSGKIYLLRGDGLAVYKLPPGANYNLDFLGIDPYALPGPGIGAFSGVAIGAISVDDKDAVYASTYYEPGGG